MSHVPQRRSEGDAHHWRDIVATASGLNFLLGIWLMSAPYTLAYSHGEPFWSDIAFGAVIAMLAFARATGAQSVTALSYINFFAGTWVFVAAYWLYDSARPEWNDLIVGAAAAILAVLSVMATEDLDGPEHAWYRR